MDASLTHGSENGQSRFPDEMETLDRLGAALHERWGSLDILVANAGVLGPITPLSHVEPKQWDDIIAVNVTANWRLIRSLDALLRASDAGRVVFISSSAGPRADLRPYWGRQPRPVADPHARRRHAG